MDLSQVPHRKAFAYTPTSQAGGTFAGGTPYTSPDAEWPREEDGTPMPFLFQVDLSEVPPLEIPLPRKGYLQFFVGAEGDLYGMDLDDPAHPKHPHRRVRYLPEAQDEEQEVIPSSDDEGPLEDPEKRIYFRGKEISMLPYPYTLEAPDDPTYVEAYEEEGEEDYAFYLGGYPHFVQQDFREEGSSLVLLLGSESTDEVMWGDMGAAGYWLPEEALTAEAFEEAFLYWDCS